MLCGQDVQVLSLPVSSKTYSMPVLLKDPFTVRAASSSPAGERYRPGKWLVPDVNQHTI